MSDLQEYGADHAAKVLDEIVAVVGRDPGITLEEIQHKLGAVYAQHEQQGDQQAMTLISDAWERIQMLSDTAGQAINIAAAARQVAETMQAQRDMAVEQQMALRAGMRNPWMSDDAEVKRMIHAVETSMIDWLEFYTADVNAEIIEESDIPVLPGVATTFFSCLCESGLGEVADEAIRQALRGELADFMRQFVEKYNIVLQAQQETGKSA